MPRPKKWRRICSLPDTKRFGPLENCAEGDSVIMAVDEYETIRLIDLEGMTQEQCAQNMNVARTTVQAIYESARKKIARSIVEGIPLVIEGGEYTLCDGQGQRCGGGGCRRRKGAREE